VRSLDARVTYTLNEHTQTATDELTAHLAEVSRPESVSLMINAVRADEELAERCFRSALTHPLGFDKFLLFSSGPYNLRLHIWWPDEKRGREDVHNHRFSIFSGIVVGELQIAAYDVCQDGRMMRSYQEAHRQQDGGYQYTAPQNVKVKQISSMSLPHGSAYFLSSNVLHQVTTGAGAVAATLFVQVLEPRTSSLVLRGTREPAPTPGTRATLGPAEAERRIVSFLKILDRPLADKA
jgi:hypothetical protein